MKIHEEYKRELVKTRGATKVNIWKYIKDDLGPPVDEEELKEESGQPIMDANS